MGGLPTRTYPSTAYRDAIVAATTPAQSARLPQRARIYGSIRAIGAERSARRGLTHGLMVGALLIEAKSPHFEESSR
jgi:hypothetical protein